MQNSLLEQLCQEHQEQIVAVAFNDQNTISQGLCVKCWPQNYNKKVLLVEDVLDITKNIKEEYQQLDVDTRRNIKTLYQLMKELEQLKVFMKQSINESIKTVNDWIKNISDQDQYARSSFSVLSFDLNTSLQNAQQQVQELQKQKEKCLQFIKQQLKILRDNDHFHNCNKLLTIINEEKFDPPQNQNTQQNTQQQLDKSIIASNNLICQEHHSEIVMVDLNQKPKILKRLACVYCIQHNPTYYTAIKGAQKLYRKQETLKIQNLNKYSESIDQIKQSFNTIKITYRNVIKDVTSSLSQNNKEIKQQAETYLNNLNIDWQTLNNDEVSEFADKLSQNEQEDISKQQIYQDFIKINQEINRKINDAFIKMKQAQIQGKNQIKQLMNTGDYLQQIEIQTDLNCQHNQRKENQQKIPKIQQIKDNNNNKLKSQLENAQVNNDQKVDGKIKRKKNTEQNSKEKIKFQKQSEVEKQKDEVINNQSQNNNEKKFLFILNKTSIQQQEPCRSFSFNSDSSYLIAACEKSIKVFAFNKESLILQQSCTDQKSMIVYCTFLKNQNRFVFGCLDGSMQIWSNYQGNKQEFQFEQKLFGHTEYLGHIIYSRFENMIISSSNDYTIKFWKKSSNWELHQTLRGHNQYVCSISLNESENKLISGAYDDQILVSEPQGRDKQWTIIQVIKVDWGRRLCFITDNLFTFQPCKKDVMHIYEQKESKTGFYKSKEIAVKSLGYNCLWLFPQQFSKKQKLLVNKNCHTINIIRWKGKNKFVTDQAINFGTNEIYGSITDDGDWLVTWDDKSKQIQIRGLN